MFALHVYMSCLVCLFLRSVLMFSYPSNAGEFSSLDALCLNKHARALDLCRRCFAGGGGVDEI